MKENLRFLQKKINKNSLKNTVNEKIKVIHLKGNNNFNEHEEKINCKYSPAKTNIKKKTCLIREKKLLNCYNI